jgi:hypothetical protein
LLEIRWWTLAELAADRPFVGTPDLAGVVARALA